MQFKTFWTVLTQALTVALSGAFLNASLTLSLTCALTQALNFKCLLNCTPDPVVVVRVVDQAALHHQQEARRRVLRYITR